MSHGSGIPGTQRRSSEDHGIWPLARVEGGRKMRSHDLSPLVVARWIVGRGRASLNRGRNSRRLGYEQFSTTNC